MSLKRKLQRNKNKKFGEEISKDSNYQNTAKETKQEVEKGGSPTIPISRGFLDLQVSPKMNLTNYTFQLPGKLPETGQFDMRGINFCIISEKTIHANHDPGGIYVNILSLPQLIFANLKGPREIKESSNIIIPTKKIRGL